MQLAARLLVEGGHVAAVAGAVGYESEAAFSRLQEARGPGRGHLAAHGSRPSSNTTSLSPSPTAAKIERPSEDHETRRVMKMGWSPKSVSCRS
jgi:AraC-like DNA-binding protein